MGWKRSFRVCYRQPLDRLKYCIFNKVSSVLTSVFIASCLDITIFFIATAGSEVLHPESSCSAIPGYSGG